MIEQVATLTSHTAILGECMALWGEPNELSTQCHVCNVWIASYMVRNILRYWIEPT